MAIVTSIGLFITLRIFEAALFAIPAGFGLALGFWSFKRLKSWRYRRKLTKIAAEEA